MSDAAPDLQSIAGAKPRFCLKRCLLWGGLGVLALLVTAVIVFRDAILSHGLDPKVPFQTYQPSTAPDYRNARAWARIPDNPHLWSAADPAVDVFFVHPTTYDGGRHWNAPYDDKATQRILEARILPNYSGPFTRSGRVFAPHYRQASLYSNLTLREDARDSRRFAYGDVRQAFLTWLQAYNSGRPFVLVGIEQGGLHAARLLRDEVAVRPDLKARMVAAYIIGAPLRRHDFNAATSIPTCQARSEAGCLVAYAPVQVTSLPRTDHQKPSSEGGEKSVPKPSKALYWQPDASLEPIGTQPRVCVNPVLGRETSDLAPERLHLGGANATGLEAGDRPAFLSRQVSVACVDGDLNYSRPASGSLLHKGSLLDKKKVPNFNIFYGNLEADFEARIAAWAAQPGAHLPGPTRGQIIVRDAPIHRID
ncbi:MAG: DUF3089 domain-containing protein [Asticcacaulis sp.]